MLFFRGIFSNNNIKNNDSIRISLNNRKYESGAFLIIRKNLTIRPCIALPHPGSNVPAALNLPCLSVDVNEMNSASTCTSPPPTSKTLETIPPSAAAILRSTSPLLSPQSARTSVSHLSYLHQSTQN